VDAMQTKPQVKGEHTKHAQTFQFVAGEASNKKRHPKGRARHARVGPWLIFHCRAGPSLVAGKGG
jgi:hypothetical protein